MTIKHILVLMTDGVSVYDGPKDHDDFMAL